MLKITRFEYTYLCTIDFGYLLKKIDREEQDPDSEIVKSHHSLNESRQTGKEHRDIKDEFLKKPLGTFLNPQLEGEVLVEEIRKSLDKGGKRVFTDLFVADRAPAIFSHEDASSGLLLDEKPENTIPPGESFSVVSGTTLRFDGISLRVFPHCVLGIEIKISLDGGEAPSMDPECMVKNLKDLEKIILRKAALQRVERFLASIKERDVWRDFHWIDRMYPQRVFDRLSSNHRFLLIAATVDGGSELSMEMLRLPENRTDEQIVVRDELARELSGILNRSRWFNNYSPGYVEEITKKMISYQRNEFFITDGHCTLSFFPEFWSGEYTLQKGQFIKNMICATHYLLSWESMANYFDGYLRRAGNLATPTLGSLREGGFDRAFNHLRLLEHISDLLRHSISIRSIVSHGFTGRVLAQFLEEREMGSRFEEISIQLEGFSSRLRNAVSGAKHDTEHNNQLILSKSGLGIALLALVVSALFSVLSFCRQQSQMQSTPTPTVATTPTSAPSTTATVMPARPSPTVDPAGN